MLLLAAAGCIWGEIDDDDYVEYVEKQAAIIREHEHDCAEMNEELETQFQAIGSKSKSYGWHVERRGEKIRSLTAEQQKVFFDQYGARLEAARKSAEAGISRCKPDRKEWVLMREDQRR